MYSVSPRYPQIVSLSLLSLLVQKRCCLIQDIPRRTALANKALSVGWTSCFSSKRCSHLHSLTCLLWRREKYFPGHLEMHAACQSCWCGTAPSLTENKLCSPMSEKKSDLHAFLLEEYQRIILAGRCACKQTVSCFCNEGEKQKEALRCCREPIELVLSLGLSH